MDAGEASKLTHRHL